MFEFENEKCRLLIGADYYANRDVFDVGADLRGFGEICHIIDDNEPIEIRVGDANGNVGENWAFYFLNKWPQSPEEWADIFLSLYGKIDVDKIRHGYVRREENLDLDEAEYWAKRIIDVAHFRLWDEEKKEFRRATFHASREYDDVADKKDTNKRIRELIVKDLRLRLIGLHEIKEEIC